MDELTLSRLFLRGFPSTNLPYFFLLRGCGLWLHFRRRCHLIQIDTAKDARRTDLLYGKLCLYLCWQGRYR
jgi:hypothetical protein